MRSVRQLLPPRTEVLGIQGESDGKHFGRHNLRLPRPVRSSACHGFSVAVDQPTFFTADRLCLRNTPNHWCVATFGPSTCHQLPRSRPSCALPRHPRLYAWRLSCLHVKLPCGQCLWPIAYGLWKKIHYSGYSGRDRKTGFISRISRHPANPATHLHLYWLCSVNHKIFVSVRGLKK